MPRSASRLALVALVALAGCGEPINEKALKQPAPAAQPAAPVIAAEVSAKSPLQICIENAKAVTPAVDACFSDELKQRNDALSRYVTAAIKRLTDSQESTEPFEKGQTAWMAYRQAHCDAVLEHWKDGTIRTSKSLACSIDVTAARTHQIWKDFLTFEDTTPPVLPEPLPSD